MSNYAFSSRQALDSLRFTGKRATITLVRQDTLREAFAFPSLRSQPIVVGKSPVVMILSSRCLGGHAGGHCDGASAFMAKTIRTYLGHRSSRATISAFKRSGKFGKIPPEDILLRMDLQEWKCFYCKDTISLFTCELDHVHALVTGGEHYLYNIVLACHTCNIVKNARSLKRFCKIMRLDLNALRQEISELNAKQHELTDWNDEYASNNDDWSL